MEEKILQDKKICLTSNGYVRQSTPTGRRLAHRIVWEEYHNACLLRWGEVHHINHIKIDNRIQNLKAMMNSDHTILHKTKDMSDRICYICNSDKTSPDSKGRLIWRRHPITKQKWLCHKCYCAIQNKRRWSELIADTERHIQYNIKRNKKV